MRTGGCRPSANHLARDDSAGCSAVTPRRGGLIATAEALGSVRLDDEPELNLKPCHLVTSGDRRADRSDQLAPERSRTHTSRRDTAVRQWPMRPDLRESIGSRSNAHKSYRGRRPCKSRWFSHIGSMPAAAVADVGGAP
jgi:hypothetical protein